MKKILIAVLVLVVAVAVIVYFSLNTIIKHGVETLGSKATGTSVELRSVSISPLSGKGTMSGFSVGNPAGFKNKNAFSMNVIRLALDVNSLLSDTIKIDEIYIDAPHVTYEKSGRADNIITIMNHVRSSAGKSTKAEKEKADDKESGPQKNVVIDDVIIKNGKVDIGVTALEGKGVSVDLPDIHLKDIGKDGKSVTLDEAVEIIFSAITKNVGISVANSAQMIREKAAEEVEKAVGGSVEGTTDKLKGLFGK